MGVLDQVRERYELNETAERYLLSDRRCIDDRSRTASRRDRTTNWTGLASTVRAGRPATPIDDDPAGFYGPLVRGTFATQRRAALFCARMIGVARLRGEPRVLDIGAGSAPWSVSLLEANERLTAVINDLPGVIEIAREKIADHGFADRCEFRAGDFRELAFEDDHYDLVVFGSRVPYRRGARFGRVGRAGVRGAPSGTAGCCSPTTSPTTRASSIRSEY